MLPNEIRNKVAAMLMDRVDDIFTTMQKDLGIEKGDVSPIDLDNLRSLQIKLANCIADALDRQYSFGEKEQLIHFISIDKDGNETDYHIKPSEMLEEWEKNHGIPFDNERTLPSDDDTILTCRYGGTQMYFETFGELYYAFLGDSK